MATLIIYARNLLEGSILTMTPSGAVSGKGPDRLIDRDIDLECEDAGTTGTRTWHADRGAAADTTTTVRVWFFAGRNYSGETITLQSSTDNSTWTTRETITPTSDAPQRVQIAPPYAIPRYIRWQVTDPAAPVVFTESFLGVGASFTATPTARHTQEPLIPNTVLLTSQSGRAYGIQRGARRWSTRYMLTVATEEDRALFFDILDAVQDGVLPFLIQTVKQEFRWVRIASAIVIDASPGLPIAHHQIPLEFIEEL